MPSRLSPATGAAIDRDIVIAGVHLSQHEIQQLVSSYRCSLRTIYWRQAWIQAERPLLARTSGQQRVITPEIDRAIYYLLNDFLWFYQDEIVEFLYEVFSIEAYQNTISMALARIKFIRKRLKIEAV